MMQMVKVLRGLRQEDVPSQPLENASEATFEELSRILTAILMPTAFWTLGA